MHNGATFLNKHKHQVCGMQFVDNKIRHNDAILLPFRKPVSREYDKVAQLAKEVLQKNFKLEFQDVF